MKDKEYIFDYHVHTLEHGLGKKLKVEETVIAAIEMGLKSICITDHFPLPQKFADPTMEKDCAMPREWYGGYIESVAKIGDKYRKDIKIALGAEVDYLPQYENWLKEELKKQNFDYVLGSVHFAGQISDSQGRRNFVIDYTEEEFRNGVNSYGGIKPLVKAYFKLIRRMILSGLFDGVGHMDLIKKYNYGSIFDHNETWYREEVSATLEVIAGSGMVMEVNTSGWEKKCWECYPSVWILEEVQKRGIGITFGSDTHKPEGIGKNIEQARRIVKDLGFDKAYHFIKRKKKEVCL